MVDTRVILYDSNQGFSSLTRFPPGQGPPDVPELLHFVAEHRSGEAKRRAAEILVELVGLSVERYESCS